MFGAVLAIAVLFSLWRLAQRPDSAGPPPIRLEAPDDPRLRSRAAAGPGQQAVSDPTKEKTPPSLVGREVEGELLADARGRLVLSPETLRLYDFYLGARGEASSGWIQSNVQREIETRLPASAQAEARSVFDQYVDYLDATADLGAVGVEPGDLEGRRQRLRELRREIFGVAAAEALFVEEDKIQSVAVERRRIMSDPTLDDRERIQALAALQQQLPETVRQKEAEAYKPLRLAQEEERLRNEGASEAEIQALRDEYVGDQAGGRLKQLDRDRAVWSVRMEEYRVERDKVLHNVRNAPEESKAVFLRRVRERHFDPEELPRVEALDRIELRDRSLGRVPVPVPAPAPATP